MRNRIQTYKYIADILSFKTSDNDLRSKLSAPSFDWDHFVIEGSAHLVLPGLYCRLKQRELLECLPHDLRAYLEELTAINRNRNVAVRQQIKSLSDLFKAHQIAHVFLKGSALLVADYYQDYGERMIGDIDILIPGHQLHKAFDLLCECNYSYDAPTFGQDFVEHKHLPRLQTSEHIAAVELHRKLFVSYNHPALNSSALLEKKQSVNGIYIPSESHLLLHCVLNYQINDRGATYKTANFRTDYDVLVLTRDRQIQDQIQTDAFPVRNYLKYHNVLFDHQDSRLPTLNPFQKMHYLMRLRFPRYEALRRRGLGLLDLLGILISKSGLFLKNKSYRAAVLKDRRRLMHQIKHQLIKGRKPLN